MTDYQYKRTRKGIKKMKTAGAEGGRKGGAISPGNFKNHPDTARLAGIRSGEVRREKRRLRLEQESGNIEA